MEIGLDALIAPFFFIFGTLIGSFLNVVILRHNTGKDLSGRSRCSSCGTTLTPSNLIPIISFLFQKGVCRTCKSKISIQYPIVEFVTGVLFLLIFFTYNSVPGAVFSVIVSSLLIVIVVYDIRHRVIPNTFAYGFIGMSIFSLFFDVSSLSYIKPSLSMLIAGPILALPIWFLWQISGGKWIGLGDAKLFLGVGWFLGVSEGATVFVLSFWIGAGVSLCLIFLSRLAHIKELNLGLKDLTIKNEVPFAPFIILSFLIVYLFEFNIISIIAP